MTDSAAPSQTPGQMRATIVQLEAAVETGRRIGMAVGILMARQKLSGDAAWALLVTASQSQHRKVRDIAEDVIGTGTI
jgi:AmiR/NasT family two-component response regulator